MTEATTNQPQASEPKQEAPAEMSKAAAKRLADYFATGKLPEGYAFEGGKGLYKVETRK